MPSFVPAQAPVHRSRHGLRAVTRGDYLSSAEITVWAGPRTSTEATGPRRKVGRYQDRWLRPEARDARQGERWEANRHRTDLRRERHGAGGARGDPRRARRRP